MKVMVTGGAGFIGSHLVERLSSLGHQVVVVDNLASGNLNNLLGIAKGQIRLVQASILEDISGYMEGCSMVFHLAALPGVIPSLLDPRATNRVNVDGTLNVLECARQTGVSRVIFASTSSVYGDTEVLPKEEDMLPRPISPYAASKLAGEYYCEVYRRSYGIQTVCLRYFNVYGPRQNAASGYAAVIPNFISRIKQGLPPVIYGNGQQSRDFTYVVDVVTATILAAESQVVGVCNVGSGHQYTVNEVLSLVQEILGDIKEPILEYKRQGDVSSSLADINKARSFGYVPQYELSKGVRQTIESYTSVS